MVWFGTVLQVDKKLISLRYGSPGLLSLFSDSPVKTPAVWFWFRPSSEQLGLSYQNWAESKLFLKVHVEVVNIYIASFAIYCLTPVLCPGECLSMLGCLLCKFLWIGDTFQ